MVLKMFDCIRCGEVFGAKANFALYCPDCRKEVAKENSAASRARNKAEGHKPKHKAQNMQSFLRELDKYNKEHGTHLTYGQFESLRSMGRLT
jgi:predicted  nucleic acid-binding Zn-ribbon protein